MSRPIVPIMVGTAGHIDHGKSSLVRVLTGIDPDRLKEEKERGLTIDLGFAPLALRDGRLLGMVDVPGHERFVKNMVAGSTALDLALIVVAADDSVMPQTVEHIEILQLLGVRQALVALTKVDMVDGELADLAEEEVRGLLTDTPYAEAPIIRVSSITRSGIDELRARLEELALGIRPRSPEGPFRMSVQRVFKLEGIGTVVTGIPVSGTAHIGDELEVLPRGAHIKVRAIQAFRGAVERAVAGHSTALSVPDAKDLGIHRGDVVGEPGVFHAGEHIDVEVEVLARGRAIPHRSPIRFHTGTAEARGVLSVLDGDALPPGSTTIARMLLDEPVCCVPGDRFLLRTMNPPRTIGGGTVLRVLADGGRYRRQRVADQVRSLLAAGNDPQQRLFEIVRQGGALGVTAQEVSTALTCALDEATARLRAHEQIHWHERGRRAFASETLEDGAVAVVASVDRILRDRPLSASIPRSALRTTRDFPPELKEAALDHLVAVGKARSLADGRVLFVDRLKSLPAEAAAELEGLVAHCESAAFRPPSADELSAALGLPPGKVTDLIARGGDEGRLEVVGEHVYGAATLRRVLLSIARNCLSHDGILDIPQLRDELGTSRKYLIPLLEHVDGMGLTRLRGGERRLIPASDAFASIQPLLDLPAS